MAYNISWFLNGRLEGTEHSDGFPFSAVKDHARNFVETGVADRVEVRDDNEALVFQHPRTLRNA